jgi:predicted MFS family arabinose efflux permease
VLLLMRESPASRATTVTLNTVALSLGMALGSMLGGVMLTVGDFPLLGGCAVVLSGMAAGLVWLTREAPLPSPAMLEPVPEPLPGTVPGR